MPRPLAIVTGSSSGIGAALAPLLARDGHDLLLVARRESLLADVAAKTRAAAQGARAEVLALDLVAPGAAKALAERAPDAAVVVNNAGFGWFGEAAQGDAATFRRMIDLNCTALTEITTEFARRMIDAGRAGTILNVASTAAFQPIPFAAVYCATKSFVVAFSEAMHYETRRKNVAVLAFCPGPTATEFGAAAGVAAEVESKNGAFYQSVEAVAESAARAIRRRAETRVPGFLNNVMALLARTSYWRLARWSAALMFEQAARKPALKG